jgi:predicted ester cyclase
MNTAELEPHQMPKAIVNRLFAGFLNEGDLSVVDQLVSPKFTGPAGTGPDGIKAMILPLRQGFPDLHFTIQDMLVEGSQVVVRWTSEGTHRGVFAGVAPTGRQVSNEGIGIYRVEEGKIVETWSQVDRLGVLQQIGAVPLLGRDGPAPQATKPLSSAPSLRLV